MGIGSEEYALCDGCGGQWHHSGGAGEAIQSMTEDGGLLVVRGEPVDEAYCFCAACRPANEALITDDGWHEVFDAYDFWLALRRVA